MNNATNSFLNAVQSLFNYPLFKLGEGALTLGLILKLLLLFGFVLIIEHVLRRHLTTRLLKRTRLDVSLQYGIARIGGTFSFCSAFMWR